MSKRLRRTNVSKSIVCNDCNTVLDAENCPICTEDFNEGDNIICEGVGDVHYHESCYDEREDK